MVPYSQNLRGLINTCTLSLMTLVIYRKQEMKYFRAKINFRVYKHSRMVPFRSFAGIPYSYKFSHGQIFAHLLCAKIRNFSAYLFSRTFRFWDFKNLIYGNTNEKQGVGFAKIYLRFFLCAKVKKFSTNFRAISRKLRCPRENLYE
jgi:hypothetical protein